MIFNRLNFEVFFCFSSDLFTCVGEHRVAVLVAGNSESNFKSIFALL